MNRAVIGLDLGGTNIKSVALSPGMARPFLQKQIRTEAEQGVDHVVGNIIRLIHELADASLKEGRRISAIGIGSAGLVDKGVVRNSPNLPGWHGSVHLLDLLESRLPRNHPPLRVENDVNCFIVAEHAIGAAQGYDNAVGLAIGTGVGGGIIIEGNLYPGSWGGAGELGHMAIEFDGPLCKCGNRGCLEALIGTEAIIKRYRRMSKGSMDLTVERISELAKGNDQAAIRTFSETGRILGVALANVANIFNPQVVVIGGGVAQAGRFLVDPAKQELMKRAMPYNAKGLRIKVARLGPLAGAIGAALLAEKPGKR